MDSHLILALALAIEASFVKLWSVIAAAIIVPSSDRNLSS
jgi:hypothetical protein